MIEVIRLIRYCGCGKMKKNAYTIYEFWKEKIIPLKILYSV